MSRWLALTVCAVALVGGGVWWFSRGHEGARSPSGSAAEVGSGGAAAEAPDHPTAAGAAVAPPSGAKAALAGRALPALPDRPQLSAEAAFDAESRDDDWAAPTEAELKKRWKGVRGGRLVEAACRATQCRLTVEGSEAELQKTIADLEGAHGLHGYAETLFLAAPDRHADGTVTLHAFALFER